MPLTRAEIIQKLHKDMPEVVSRQEACEYIGNIITPKTLRNLDCLNKGPAKRHLAGKKVFYHKDDFLNWFYNYQSDISRNIRHQNTKINDNQNYDTNMNQKNHINHELHQFTNLSSINKLPSANPFLNSVRSHL